jgi:hypothetical protein
VIVNQADRLSLRAARVLRSLDVIRAITTNAAAMLGWQDRVVPSNAENSPTSSPFPAIPSQISQSLSAFGLS